MTMTHEKSFERQVNARLGQISRRSLLRNGAVAGGALAALSFTGVTFAQGATPAMNMTPGATPMGGAPFKNDVDVLNYALTLEHLEATFYRDGLKQFGTSAFEAIGFQSGVFDYLSMIGQHEAAHVDALTSAIKSLGGTPVAEAKYDFGYKDAKGFLGVAMALEDTGVAAYTGAARYLMDSGQLLTAALTIHGVEARHAAYLAVLNSKDPFPAALNPFLTKAEVLKIAGPFIVGQ